MFEAVGIEKSFRSKSILRGADLSVAAGESVALVGENGAGKSTFMNISAGVLKPDAGTISICLLYTSPSPRDKRQSRMPSSA